MPVCILLFLIYMSQLIIVVQIENIGNFITKAKFSIMHPMNKFGVVLDVDVCVYTSTFYIHVTTYFWCPY